MSKGPAGILARRLRSPVGAATMSAQRGAGLGGSSSASLSIHEVDDLVGVFDAARVGGEFRGPEELLSAVCTRVVNTGWADAAAVFLARRDNRHLVVGGSHGVGRDHLERLNLRFPPRLERSDGLPLSPTAEAQRFGRPVWIEDVASDARLEAWWQTMREEGFQSMLCLPLVVRSRVIGVLDFYWKSPMAFDGHRLRRHQVVSRVVASTFEAARLGSAIQRAAADQKRLLGEVRETQQDMTQAFTRELRLAEALAEDSAVSVERLAQILVAGDEAALVVSSSLIVVAFAGPAETRNHLLQAARRREVSNSLRGQSYVNVEGASCLRLGPAERGQGILVIAPAFRDGRDPRGQTALLAAQLMGAAMLAMRSDRALETFAQPAIGLGLAHGLYSEAQIQELAGVFGLPAGGLIQMAVIICAGPESAQRRCQRPAELAESGWSVVTATASGPEVLVLNLPGPAEAVRQAGVRLRERHPEIQSIGVSSVVPGLAALPTAYRQARLAATSRPASVTLYDEMDAFHTLIAELAPGRAEHLLNSSLGALIRHDEEYGTRLVETLDAYVRHSGHVQAASRELGVHPNTFHQRLRRAAGIGDFDVHDYQSLGRLAMALQWRRVLTSGSAPRLVDGTG